MTLMCNAMKNRQSDLKEAVVLLVSDIETKLEELRSKRQWALSRLTDPNFLRSRTAEM